MGIIILVVVVSLVKIGEVDIINVVYLIISVSVFLVGVILFGCFFNDGFVFFVEKFKIWGRVVILVLIIVLFMVYIGIVIYLEVILGVFVVGLVLDNLD